MEGELDYYDDYEEEEVDYQEVGGGDAFLGFSSPQKLYDDCLQPTLIQVFHQVQWLLCFCLAVRLLITHVRNERLKHIFTAAMGVASLVSFVGLEKQGSLLFAGVGLLVVRFSGGSVSKGRAATCLLLFYLVFREYFGASVGLSESAWEEVRGIQMIMVMKILSLVYDSGMGLRSPSWEEYLGYLLCPANIIFGPWIPFEAYLRFLRGDASRSILWITPALCIALSSVASLTVSSCLVYYVFFGLRSSWLLAVRDAMSVRFSHYFVSYFSEFSCYLCGFADDSIVSVSEPWRIELPRSLVDVVVCWNKPMHRWLRVYVFKPTLTYGSFAAVLWTFAVSSMLHGLNFGLTAVLLSLGFYTYVEHTLREKLASIFDACVRSRKCSRCSHKYKGDNGFVFLVNLALGALAYFNLAYLGIMIAKSPSSGEEASSVLDSIAEDLNKWGNLGFLSHWVMIFTLFGSLVI